MKHQLKKIAIAIVFFSAVAVPNAFAAITGTVQEDGVYVESLDPAGNIRLAETVPDWIASDIDPSLPHLYDEGFYAFEDRDYYLCNDADEFCIHFWYQGGVFYATDPSAVPFGSGFVVEQVSTLTASLGYMASHYIGNILAIFAALVGLGGALMFIRSYIGKKA